MKAESMSNLVANTKCIYMPKGKANDKKINVGKYILHPIARLLKSPQEKYWMNVSISTSQISTLVEDINTDKGQNKEPGHTFRLGEWRVMEMTRHNFSLHFIVAYQLDSYIQ